jgi:hypothetical protein
VSPSLITFPLKASKVQNISKTILCISTLPHSLLVDRENMKRLSAHKEFSVSLRSFEKTPFDVAVYHSIGKHRRWPPRQRRGSNQGRLPEGIYNVNN